MTGRPLHHALGPAALAAVGALTMWRAFPPVPLWLGLIAGAICGMAAGWLLGRRAGGPASTVLHAVAAIAVVVLGLIAVTADPGAVAAFPDDVATFLTVGLPADGLPDLAAVPYALSAVVVGAATAAALRSHLWLVVAVAGAGLIVASILAAPVGVPWWVPALSTVVLAGSLMVASRFDYSELEPLVGTSTAIRRNQHWWRPVVVWAPAAVLALVALLLPLPGPFDVRRLIEADVIEVADDNPLAQAARLRVDPPTGAEGVDVAVTVTGPSPGRLRVAVLDGYQPEGWHQLAEYAVTGTRLAPGLFDPADDDGGARRLADVVVVDAAAESGFAALPTAGTPIEVGAAASVLYVPAAGLLIATTDDSTVRYRTAVDLASPTAVAGTPAGLDPVLSECPDSPVVADVAGLLTEGLVDPLRRLDAIGSWLKLRRIYDPTAPGGQTLGGVERFVGQEFARRGNLEVFVTAFALLARCAGVPVRVVVGYPAPAGDARSELATEDVTAWLEVPLAGVGWVAVDALPTPAEQQRQAELAASPPPPAAPPAEPEPEAVVEVPPVAPTAASDGLRPAAVASIVGAVIVGLATAAAAWSVIVPRRTVQRRARLADPAAATIAAWTTVVERLHDTRTPLGAHLTASESARATGGRVPAPVTHMMSELAVLVDQARFGGERASDVDAGLAWALADESLARLPRGWAFRAAPLRHPHRAVARLRGTRRQARRRERWTGVVPPSATLLESAATPDVTGYTVEARIGVGATSAVYRARQDGSGRAVAIKVFAADVNRRNFDHQRFVWEARVAELVSGRPNLPEVLGSGFTTAGQPYLVTKLYRHGTLAARVRDHGPLPVADVVDLGRRLAVALQALHDNGVLHGDVKPENVFIDDDDSMVLGDLGSAWTRAPGGPAATMSMTPAYAAPEVWLGHPPTAAADLYSLGLTLMHAASGERPRPGSPPGPEEVVAAFGSDVALGLLEVDPRRRFRSARAVAEHFGADLDDRAASVGAFRLPPPSWTIRAD